MIEDQREREREIEILRQSQQPQYDSLTYKDTRIKTFLNEYVQQKYKNASTSFPQRSTYTINIKSVNSNLNDDYGLGTYSYKKVIHKSICPGCGQYVASQVGGNYDNLCLRCGKIKQA